MERIDRWIAAVWAESKLKGVVVIVLLALLVIVVLALLASFLGIDVAGGIRTLVNWNS